jgi:hypothetical protein
MRAARHGTARALATGMKILDTAVLADVRGGQGYFQPPAFDAQSVWDHSKAIQKRLYEPFELGSRTGIPLADVPRGIQPCLQGDQAIVHTDPPGQNGRLSCVSH